MICETCGKEHDGSYGSGRFCSEKCARSFSTSKNREEINRKRSNTLKGHKVSDETKKKLSQNNPSHDIKVREKIKQGNKRYWNNLSEKEKKSVIENRRSGLINYYKENGPDSIMDVSKRTMHKVLYRMNIGCLVCGWNEAHCDVHHINGKKIDNPDAMSNLTYVCPNCHRLIHSNKISKEKLVSLEDAIGDSWKDFYFG